MKSFFSKASLKRLEHKMKWILEKGIFIAIFLVIFTFSTIFSLIITSQTSFHDFFTTGKVSELNDRPSNITKNIIVDALSINKSGGIANVLENVVNGIARKRPDWFFTVLCAIDLERPFKFENKNIKTIYIDQACSKSLIIMRNILDYCSFGLLHDQITQLLSYDKVIFNKHSCDLIFDPYAEFSLNDYYDIPKVSLIHDILYIDKPDCFNSEAVKWREENAPRMLQSSTKIVTVSDFTRKRVIDAYKLNQNFVKTILTKLSTRVKKNNAGNQSAVSDKKTLDKFALKTKNYLIYTSVIRNHKNHRALLLAFIKFAKRNPSKNLKLVFIGTTKPSVIKQAYELIEQQSDNKIQGENLKNRLIFTQFIPDEELSILLSNALAMIFPSLYEGFGMPVIEAMSTGIPVACSNVTSLPEVAGDAALLFDPYNVDDIEKAIEKITGDEKLREELIKKGYKRAEFFSDTDSMIDEYIKVFEECMSK